MPFNSSATVLPEDWTMLAKQSASVSKWYASYPVMWEFTWNASDTAPEADHAGQPVAAHQKAEVSLSTGDRIWARRRNEALLTSGIGYSYTQ